MTHFGTSAKFIDAAAKLGLTPGKTHDLDRPARHVLDRQPAVAGRLRLRLSRDQAGHPAGLDFRRHRHRFLLRRSAIRCCRSGAAKSSAAAWAWRSMCSTTTASRCAGKRANWCAPSPSRSMPVGFWNDPDGSKYHAAYFERFPGIWCHGDFAELHRARRRDHLRPLGRDAQPRRRAHRHRGNLPPGRAVAGNPRIAGHRPGLAAGQARRRARRALRQAAGRADAR